MSYDLIGDFVKPLLKAAGVPFNTEYYQVSVETGDDNPPVLVSQETADLANWNETSCRWIWLTVSSALYETYITYDNRHKRVKKLKSKRT